MSMFKLSDIKAGYLLRVRDLEANEDFNMTVVPSTGTPKPRGLMGLILNEVGIITPGDDGMLSCCGTREEKDFWPLSQFNDDLVTKMGAFQIQAVYGYAAPAQLLDNSTEDRECLWARADFKATEETADASEAPEFTKADLKDGMFFRLSDGSWSVIVNGIAVCDDGEFVCMEELNEDLTWDYAGSIEIVLEGVHCFDMAKLQREGSPFVRWVRPGAKFE